MSKRFSIGGYQPTDPQPEFKIEEVTYGDGVKAWQVLEYTHVGFVQVGGNFGSLKRARKHLDTCLSEKRARVVTDRKQVYPCPTIRALEGDEHSSRCTGGKG